MWSCTKSLVTSTACSTPSTACCTTPVATRLTRLAIDFARFATELVCLVTRRLVTRGLVVAALFRRVADFRRGAAVLRVPALRVPVLRVPGFLPPLAAMLRFAADTPRFAAISPRLAALFVAGPRLAALFLVGARLPVLLLVEVRVALFLMLLFRAVLLRAAAPRLVADFAPPFRAADLRAGALRVLVFLPAVPTFLLPLLEPPRDDFLAAAMFQAPRYRGPM